MNSSTRQLANFGQLSKRDALILILLLIPIWSTRYLPLQDYPDWLLEGRIFSRIHSPEFDFAAHYKICLVPIPNIASTVVIGALDRVVPIEIAGKIFLSLYVLLYAASIFYLFRSMPAAAHNESAAQYSPPASRLELIPLLFTYNYFFFVGNLNYLFSLPWLFFAIGYVVRRLDAFAWRHTIVLSLIFLMIYFSHLVSFAIAALGLLCFIVCTRSPAVHRGKSPLKALCALIPSLILLALFIASTTAPFEFTYFHSIGYWVASLVTPFLPFFQFYPVNLHMLTFMLNILFGIFILSLFLILDIRLFGTVLRSGSRTHESQLLDSRRLALGLLSTILFLLVLISPSNIGGLVRPNQRMALPWLIVFLAFVSEPWLEKRLPSRSVLVLALASLIALHTFSIANVSRRMDTCIETILKTVPRGSSFYIITERFDTGKRGALRPIDRVRSLFAPSIYPFDRAAFYYTLENGGRNPHLFDTSIVRLKEPLTPARPGGIDTRSTDVGSLDALLAKIKAARERIAAEFSHVILVGSPASIPAMQRALLPDFSPIAFAPALCILSSQGTIAHETRK